jgi:hypothetical protein
MSPDEVKEPTITARAQLPAENEMVQRERWGEIRRLYFVIFVRTADRTWSIEGM